MNGQIVNENAPKRQYRGSYVYAVLFSDGWVKVGRGAKPAERIQTHRSISKMRGAVLSKKVISGELVDSKSAEAELINFCRSNGEAIWGNEWFTKVDFEQLESFILDKFSGDSAEQFEAAAIAREESTNRFMNALGLSVPARDDKWIFCFQLAQLMHTMCLNAGAEGSQFDRNIRGASSFEVSFSLLAYCRSDVDRAELVALVTGALIDGDIGDCLYSLERDTRELLISEGYLKGEAA